MENTHSCAILGFFRICCPNLSVLKIGLCAASELPLAWPDFDFEDEAFAEGWWAFEKRSLVARGILFISHSSRVI